ncbi:hypothetical protein H1R20_g9246, partial [Candolleomyces eurysporus]
MADFTAELDEIHNIYVQNYLMLSSQTLDYLDTFEAEVTYIWVEPWKLGKLLFFLSRYVTVMGFPVSIYCKVGSF